MAIVSVAAMIVLLAVAAEQTPTPEPQPTPQPTPRPTPASSTKPAKPTPKFFSEPAAKPTPAGLSSLAGAVKIKRSGSETVRITDQDVAHVDGDVEAQKPREVSVMVDNAETSILSSGETYRYSYKVVLTNQTMTPTAVHLQLKWVNSEGYVVHDEDRYDVPLKGLETLTLSDWTLIDHVVARQITDIKAIVKHASPLERPATPTPVGTATTSAPSTR